MLLFIQDNLEEAVSEEKTLSIIQLIKDGGLGGQIIIALLFVLLAIALYIYFERFFAIKAAAKVDKDFMNQIKDYVSNGKLESADALCKSKNSPTARLIGKGISRIGKPLDDINKAIENAGKLEVYQLEKKCFGFGNNCWSSADDWIFRNCNRYDYCNSRDSKLRWSNRYKITV